MAKRGWGLDGKGPQHWVGQRKALMLQPCLDEKAPLATEEVLPAQFSLIQAEASYWETSLSCLDGDSVQKAQQSCPLCLAMPNLPSAGLFLCLKSASPTTSLSPRPYSGEPAWGSALPSSPQMGHSPTCLSSRSDMALLPPLGQFWK